MSFYSVLFFLLHASLGSLLTFILLFSSNVYLLAFCSSIMLQILVLNYVFGDCPITLMEDKFHIHSSIDLFFRSTINLIGEKYKKEFRPIMTLELVWIGVLLFIQKAMLLMLFPEWILQNIQ